ncbi:MAG: hypothetical protein K2Y37_02265 [Pirellulales bacterium]|nr:hypothetical protein [Pirellulales bacterium]
MTIDDFIAMTKRIIAKDGFSGYLPTLVVPASSKVKVLEGIPDNVDIETASRKWAYNNVEPAEDFFLAFKSDASHFKVVVRSKGKIEERVVAVSV